MPLHIDYRPQSFDEVKGNTNTVNVLKSKLEQEDIPHAFLFSGPSGCGKTTLARLVKDKLKCGDMDFKEIDTADFRGIETVRAIRQQMALQPMDGPVRIWLLDECHQLSKDAQSALLKALEDTPPHVYFLLATTEPEKLLPTIRNRCMVFNVTLLNERRITELLEWVCGEENMGLPDDVYKQIAIASMGSPRAALVLLDKVIDLPKGEMLEAVEEAAIKESQVIDLCTTLLNKRDLPDTAMWPKVIDIINGLKEEEPERVRRAVLNYCNAVMLSNKGGARAFLIMDVFREPFYNTGHAGLTLACWDVVKG